MRDPDLVVRAQRAATALESAWGRWRNMHGLATDPPPAVSSYVGYSMDAPWGEGRIVFGICAEEAEQLVELLERHDCVGPIHASVTAMPGDIPWSPALEGAAGQPGLTSLLSVPAPAPASAGQQPLPPGAVGSRPADLLARRQRGPARDPDETSPLTASVAPATDDTETPIARAVSRALEAALASRRTPSSDLSAAPRGEPAPPAVPAPWTPQAAQAGGSGEDRAETARVAKPERPGGPAGRPAPPAPDASGVPGVTAFRFRRPVATAEHARAVPATPADPAGLEDTVQTPVPVRPPDDRDRVASAARHAEAATWGASEVPGQAAVTDSAV
jgi:hypothetical protein